MNHPLSDMMTSSMGKIRDMIDVNTVIGDPISAGDVTIIPVTKVSIGYGAGGSDFATKKNQHKCVGAGAPDSPHLLAAQPCGICTMNCTIFPNTAHLHKFVIKPNLIALRTGRRIFAKQKLRRSPTVSLCGYHELQANYRKNK